METKTKRKIKGELSYNHPFQDELAPGEDLLWVGQPEPGGWMPGGNPAILMFALMWLTITLIWYGIVVALGGFIFYMVVGLPFLAIGFWLLFGAPTYALWQRRHTYYGVTDKRLLILQQMRHKVLTALEITGIKETHSIIQPDGVGDVHFMLRGRSASFEKIADAQQVAALVNRLRHADSSDDEDEQIIRLAKPVGKRKV